jgi:hypothetical protein
VRRGMGRGDLGAGGRAHGALGAGRIEADGTDCVCEVSRPDAQAQRQGRGVSAGRSELVDRAGGRRSRRLGANHTIDIN